MRLTRRAWIFSPVDFRGRHLLPMMPRSPAWTEELHVEIQRALVPYSVV